MIDLISELPPSPVNLTEKNKKKIYNNLPVPSDYKILWADIDKFRGYPSGLVITDKGIIIKSSKKDVKNFNKKNKDINQDKIAKVKILYRIIPWEYFNPLDYSIKQTDIGKQKPKYIIYANGVPLSHFYDKELFTLFEKKKNSYYEQQKIAETVFENSTISAMNSTSVEDIFFNATYGKDTLKTGHGIYAEEAGTILDRLNGDKVSIVGRDNAKNGPDKIINTVPVQCKYCKSAQASINACFKKDSLTGNMMFRYLDLNGNPMKIEVPADQYSQAVELMKKRISNGQVNGITDVNKAYDIIRKGKITYNQALNLAKAGTIESISYDAFTGAVNCLSVFGISSLFSFAQIYWCTKDIKQASKTALITGVQVYGMTWFSGVLASQISRTSLVNSLTPITEQMIESLNPQFVQNIINSFRYMAGKKAIYGAAAQKSFIKFFNSSIITQSMMVFIFGIPDTFRFINNKISKAQYVKNMLSLVSSFLISAGTTAVVGAKIGEKLGNYMDNETASKFGKIGGLTCGAATGAVIKIASNTIHEDDAIIITRLFNAILNNMMIDYLLTSKEQDLIIGVLNNHGKELTELQQNLLNSNQQEKDIKDFLFPIFEQVIEKRVNITTENEMEMNDEIENVIRNGDLRYEM